MPHIVVSRILLIALLPPIVLIWLYHLAQRGYAGVGEKKRTASLLLTIVLLAIYAGSYFMNRFAIDDLLLIPLFALAAAFIVWKREALLLYRLTCAQCGKPLALKRILFFDSGLCEVCDPIKKEGGATP